MRTSLRTEGFGASRVRWPGGVAARGGPLPATKGRTQRGRGAAAGEGLGGVGPRVGGPLLGATWCSGGGARPGQCHAAG